MNGRVGRTLVATREVNNVANLSCKVLNCVTRSRIIVIIYPEPCVRPCPCEDPGSLDVFHLRHLGFTCHYALSIQNGLLSTIYLSPGFFL